MNTNRLLTVAVLCVMTSIPVAMAEDPTTQATEERAKQEFIKQQFTQLTTRMLQVAELIEKTEPESAKALRSAVSHAQRAFIAEDMDKVTECLKKGLATMAAKTESNVIEELHKVLETLRRGALDVDQRLQRIKEWEKFLADVNRILQEQRKLEQTSRLKNSGDELSQRMQKLAAELEGIVGEQKKLLDDTQKLPVDETVKQLGALRDEIRKLIASQEALRDATKTAPIDRLPVAAEAQKALAGKTDAVKDNLSKAAADAKLSETLKKAGADPGAAAAAGKKMQTAAGEMKKAADSIGQSNPAKANSPQTQALADLKEAEKQLSEAIDKASAATPGGQLAKRQSDLAAKAAALAKNVDEAAKQAGMKSADNIEKAAGHMNEASKKLSAQDAGSAADQQKKALDQLEDHKAKLAELQRKVQEMAKTPNEKQAGEQKNLSEQTEGMAKQMQKSDNQNGSPGQSGAQSAAKNMQGAAGDLSKSDCGQANDKQNKAIKDLEQSRNELEEAIAKEREMAQAEQLAKVDALLEAVLGRQKAVSGSTKETFAKAQPGEQYERPEQLKLAGLSGEEGRLKEEIARIGAMLAKEGTTSVFPAILEEVQNDLANVQKLLADRQAGSLTQSIQTEIERNLQEMLDAIRKELGDRRNKKGGGGGGGKGGGQGGGKQPLVPPLAELKMLRSLQLQINARTTLLDKQVSGGTLSKEQSAGQHKMLSERESKVKTLTRGIADKLKAQSEEGDNP